MNRTFAHLKKAVSAYMRREPSAFVFNGFDVLEQACNDAHQWMQRMHEFEHASVSITLPSVSVTDGAHLSTAVLQGTSTAVLVRALKAAWVATADGSGELPLAIVSREEWVARRRRANNLPWDIRQSPATVAESGSLPLEVVLYGETVHLSTGDPRAFNNQSTVILHFDAIEWLSDYTQDEDTDFFLTYLFDVTLLRSVYMLNGYLKEDQRVAISDKLMKEAWESAIYWDTSLKTSSVPLTLD